MAALRAGFGKADMTPPPGLDLTGFIARENPCTGVRDPLFVRVAILEAGATRVLIAGLDCLGLDASLRDRLWALLTEVTGIPPDGVSLWCSHTHSGPALVPLHGCGRPSPEYIEEGLLPSVEEAAATALAELEPARARYSEADAGAFHRYRRPAEGAASDAARVDPRARALWIEAADGRPLGVLWFWTAHPTIYGDPLASADYPGRVAGRLESDFGGVAVFGQGCAGDVAPLQGPDRAASVRQVGDGVADALLASRSGGREIDVDACDGKRAALLLPLLPAPARSWFIEHAAFQRAEEETLPPGVARRVAGAMADWAAHWARMTPPRAQPAILQTLRIGPLRLVALPFETLSAVGWAIRDACGPEVLPVTCANGCFSYLARASQYPVGGYEIDLAYRYYGLPANYSPEAAERVIEAAVDSMSLF